MKFPHHKTCTRGKKFDYEDSEDGFTEIEIDDNKVAINCDRCGAYIIVVKPPFKQE